MASPKKNNGPKRRVALRRNQSRPARVKDWQRQADQAEDDLDTDRGERVAAKGELSRYRTVRLPDGQLPSGAQEGTVVAVRGLVAEVDDGTRIWPCTLRRVLRTRRIDGHHPIAVGDRVGFTIQPDRGGVVQEGVIESVGPRHGELKRRIGRQDRTVVANVDQVVIVSSAAMPAPKPHLIDRYLVAAHAGAMQPIVCLNKMDLDKQDAAPAILSTYEALGYPVLGTCALTGLGIDRLTELLANRSSVFAGQSGVGKSALLNAVQPGLALRTGDIIEQTTKGRHTTTCAQLLRLDCGGYVVDTPGVKAFDIAAVPLAEIEMHFVEFAACLADCKFPDCTHLHEPGCAVQAAVEDGRIKAGRYESYARMFSERAG